jgi:hypothetical protein
VATASGHGLTDGDIVIFYVTAGMVELNGQAARVSEKDTNTFKLEGINTTGYTTWSAGTCKEVTAWETLSSAQSVTMPNPAPAKIDVTTLIDKSRQYVYGLPDAPDGSITGLFNPGGAAELLIYAATNTNTDMAMWLAFAGGQDTVFNAAVSGGQGFDMQTNSAATATVSFTPVKLVNHFST